MADGFSDLSGAMSGAMGVIPLDPALDLAQDLATKAIEAVTPKKETYLDKAIKRIPEVVNIKAESVPLVAGMLCGGALSGLLQKNTKDGTSVILSTITGAGVGVGVQLMLDKAMSQKSSVSLVGLSAIAAGCGLAALASKPIKSIGFVGFAGMCASSMISAIGGSTFIKFLFKHKL